MKTIWHRVSRWLALFAMCLVSASYSPAATCAPNIEGSLNTAWECFWQQSGYPRALYKWQTPMRVRFSSASVERRKAFTLQQLRVVAELARIGVIETATDDTTANVHIEFVSAATPLPQNQPCVTNFRVYDNAIIAATIKANDQRVWHCMLHETMHLMGFLGHPLYNTVLSYFTGGNQLTEVDKLLLKTIYSDAVVSGASPFVVLEVLAQRLVDNAPDADKAAGASHSGAAAHLKWMATAERH